MERERQKLQRYRKRDRNAERKDETEMERETKRRNEIEIMTEIGSGIERKTEREDRNKYTVTVQNVQKCYDINFS